jgi:hypothetical protein
VRGVGHRARWCRRHRRSFGSVDETLDLGGGTGLELGRVECLAQRDPGEAAGLREVEAEMRHRASLRLTRSFGSNHSRLAIRRSG